MQAAVDAEHALIVAQQVTVQAGDNGSLQPMAEAAQAATGRPAQPINVVADAGYSNGEQAEACEAKGILPHVPANRGVNSRGDGTLFDRTEFTYQPESDTFLCPAGQTLARKQLMRKDRAVLYAAQPEVCGACPLKIAMHRVAATNRYPSPARRGATAHATTGHAGGDAAATSHRILGEEGYKKFLQVSADSVESTESALFRFSPELSNPADEIVQVAADFWHPKTVMAAAASKPKAATAKTPELKPTAEKPKQ